MATSIPLQSRPCYAQCDNQPTDITANKNIVTNAASTSMNIVVIPCSSLDRRLFFELVVSMSAVILLCSFR